MYFSVSYLGRYLVYLPTFLPIHLSYLTQNPRFDPSSSLLLVFISQSMSYPISNTYRSIYHPIPFHPIPSHLHPISIPSHPISIPSPSHPIPSRTFPLSYPSNIFISGSRERKTRGFRSKGTYGPTTLSLFQRDYVTQEPGDVRSGRAVDLSEGSTR